MEPNADMSAFTQITPDLSETKDPVSTREYQDECPRDSFSGRPHLCNSRTLRQDFSPTMCPTPLQMTFTVRIQRHIQSPHHTIYFGQCQADT
jgi:hypothetical protein